jgi:hypothetical protein
MYGQGKFVRLGRRFRNYLAGPYRSSLKKDTVSRIQMRPIFLTLFLVSSCVYDSRLLEPLELG